MNINICMAFDDNYAKYAGVTIASILKCSNSDEILNFYILDGNISENNKKKIMSLCTIKNFECYFIPIQEYMFEDYRTIQTHKYISLATYYRLKLSELLPNVDKIIYLDCDVVVNNSLKELYNVEMNNIEIAGVKDVDSNQYPQTTYVNAGVLVINLKEIRKNNVEQLYLDFALEHKNNITCGDQEIINSVLNGKIKILDKKWNVQVANYFTRTKTENVPEIIHYIGSNKPWIKNSWTWYKEYYFKYLRLTPWYEEEKYRYRFIWLENIIGNILLIMYKMISIINFYVPNKKLTKAVLK